MLEGMIKETQCRSIHITVDRTHARVKMLVSQQYLIAVTIVDIINLLTPNDPYIGRTAPLTSKRCIIYIYIYIYTSYIYILVYIYIFLTNIGTEYFKHGIYSPLSLSLSLSSKCSFFHNSNVFGSCFKI